MLKLKVMKSGVELMQVDLGGEKKSISIGREKDADVVLSDRAVGRKHALVLVGPDSVSVQKKSKFGKLFVNGADVEESPLKLGDEMAIADVLLQLINEETKINSSAPQKDNVFTLATSAAIASPETKSSDDSNLEPEVALEADVKSKEIPVAEENIFNNNPIELKAASSFEEGGEKTAVLDTSKVSSTLVFKAGDANHQEFSIQKPEISIGRGSDCDVVLQDKKASRKHIVIRKAGNQYVLVDLGSANGTYLNGERVTEQALSGNDVLKIGDTEFTFKAENKEYFENASQQNFISVPVEEEKKEEVDLGQIQIQSTDPNLQALSQDFGVGNASNSNVPQEMPQVEQQVNSNPGFAGIPGLTGAQKPKKESLVEKFKRQPPVRRILILIALGVALFFIFNEEEMKKETAKKSETKVEDASFAKLPKEKQQFIINTYDLAYNYYKNEQYDKALYEVEKILQILPSGYKESRDIKSYAQKAIEIVKSREEEAKRKEAEERLRLEIAELVESAQKLVDEGKDVEAKEVFTKVLEKDPENPTVLRLRQQMEEKDQKEAALLEAEKERQYKIKQFKELIAEGEALLKEGKYYEAIEKMEDAPLVLASDEELLGKAKSIIEQAKSTLRAKVEPLLKKAKSAFDEGNFTLARDAYYQTLQEDSRNVDAKEGLDKIKEILHTRAKKVYTEAVIYEGVSDFQNARAKYKECLDQAMKEDIYFGRCSRKLKRFEFLDRSASFSTDVQSMGIPSNGLINTAQPVTKGDGNDPQMPQLPEHVELSPPSTENANNSSQPVVPPTESAGSPVIDEAKKKEEQKAVEEKPEPSSPGFGEF